MSEKILIDKATRRQQSEMFLASACARLTDLAHNSE